MEHQAALESLLEVYEALRKAVRAQLDGTASYSMHRGRTDVQVRAIREALEVLAVEAHSLGDASPSSGAEGAGEAAVLQGHMQVFHALWEHILEEVVLCLSQADLPEVAGLLQCAQEGHSKFLKHINWPDALAPHQRRSQDAEKQSTAAEASPSYEMWPGDGAAVLQMQALVLENQRLQTMVHELGGWGSPGKQPPGSLQLVIPPSPDSPRLGVDPGSIAASPQSTPSRRHEPFALQLLVPRPRVDASLVSRTSKDPPEALLLNESAGAGSLANAGELLHRAQTVGPELTSGAKLTSAATPRLDRSSSTLSSLNVGSKGRAGLGPSGKKRDRRSATGSVTGLRASAEQMMGSFRRLLHTSSNQAELPIAQALEPEVRPGPLVLRGGSGLGRGGRGSMDNVGSLDNAMGRSRSITEESRSPPARGAPDQDPGYLRQTSSSAHKTGRLDDRQRERAHSSMVRATPWLPEWMGAPSSPRLDSPPAASPTTPFSLVPDGWETFAEKETFAEEEGAATPSGPAGWSVAATPTAAKLVERGGGVVAPLGEQPLNRSPGSKVPVLPPGTFAEEKPPLVRTPGGSFAVAVGSPLGGVPGEINRRASTTLRDDLPSPSKAVECAAGGAEGAPNLWTQEDPFPHAPPLEEASAEAETAGGVDLDLGSGADEHVATVGTQVVSEAGVSSKAADVGACSRRILALRDAYVGNNRGGMMGWHASQSQRCAWESEDVTGQRSVSGRENRDPAKQDKRASNPGRRGTPGAELAEGTRSPPLQKAVKGGGYVRRLSLKELRLLIEDVYASKEKRDVRCLQCGLPKESLEQHLLSFLTQKFGLRPLIAEWLGAVLTAVAAFSHVDAHVDIFGKILLNELDETARLSHLHLRKSLEQAVAEQMRAKHPYAPVDDISTLVGAAMAGSVSLQDARALVRALFLSHDSEAIVRKIDEHREAMRSSGHVATGPAASHRLTRKRLYSRSRALPTRVPMADLMQILLRHQSDVRWLALQPLVQLFPSFSGGGAALGSDEDLVALLKVFHPGVGDADVRRVLGWAEQVAGEGPINFSDCVAILTKAAGALGPG